MPPSLTYHRTRLMLSEGASQINVPAIFEKGVWMPTVAADCDGSVHTYTITATHSGGYPGCSDPAEVSVPLVVTFPSASKGPCGTKDRGTCPAGTGAGGGGAGPGSGVGQPINVGSGDVTATLPLFSISQTPLPLGFSLTYHSSPLSYSTVSVPTPFGAGWTHPFNQVMKRIPDSSPSRLYHYTSDGREFEYTLNGAVWNASLPAELRGSVSQDTTNHHFVLTDLDGTVTRFFDDLAVAGPEGGWVSTTDRWGNAITGVYSGGNLVTVVDTENRSIALDYTSGVVTSISIPEAPLPRVWRFSSDTGSTLLFGIADPLRTTTDWRSFGYDGGNRLLSVKDDASKTLEGHTYDTLGRGVTSYSEGGNSSFVKVEYDTPVPSQTTVTHRIDQSTSQVSVFSLLYQGGRWLPTRIDGPCATCGGATGDTQSFTYWPDNHVYRATDGNGNVTEFGYNTDGNVMSMTEALGTSLERTTTWAYEYPAWPNFWTTRSVPSTTSGLRTTKREWGLARTRR
ncbi:MAG: hypothetical protein IPN83_03690 [Holophagales bacterium]|nr:hypothetical protein [Holophagales bacterium]